MASPTVRTMTASEVDQVGALWGQMYAEQRDDGMLLALRDDAIDIWKRQLASRIDSPVAAVFVALDGSRVAGFLAAQIKRLPAHFAADKPKVGFISEAYVEPAARRGGVGKALVDAAFAWFAAADVGSVELHVLVGNEGGQKFWASVGFVPELVQMRRS